MCTENSSLFFPSFTTFVQQRRNVNEATSKFVHIKMPPPKTTIKCGPQKDAKRKILIRNKCDFYSISVDVILLWNETVQESQLTSLYLKRQMSFIQFQFQFKIAHKHHGYESKVLFNGITLSLSVDCGCLLRFRVQAKNQGLQFNLLKIAMGKRCECCINHLAND